MCTKLKCRYLYSSEQIPGCTIQRAIMLTWLRTRILARWRCASCLLCCTLLKIYAQTLVVKVALSPTQTFCNCWKMAARRSVTSQGLRELRRFSHTGVCKHCLVLSPAEASVFRNESMIIAENMMTYIPQSKKL